MAAAAPAAGQEAPVPIAPEARQAFSRAMEHHRKKDVDLAIDEFLKGYSVDANILSFNDEGLLDAAMTALAARLAAQPKDLGLNYRLAEITNIKGATEESLGHYRKVVALAPQSPQAAVAREEIRKLEASLAAARAASAAAAVPTTEVAPTPPPIYSHAQRRAAADEASQDKIKQLQDELQKMKDEADQSKEKLEKLQKEYDELNKKAQKWYFYYTRFFADPKNVQGLQAGQ